MITVAKLAMDMCIPNENEGAKELLNPEKLDKWLPNLYEKAIGNFYKFHLDFEKHKDFAPDRSHAGAKSHEKLAELIMLALGEGFEPSRP